MTTFYIWRDVFDKEAFYVGVKRKNGAYMVWTYLYMDGVDEIFGTEIRKAVSESKEPVEVRANVELVSSQSPQSQQ